MDKIYLDSDVLLDLLLDREPFMDDTSKLMENSIDSNTSLCVSPISITNINYIVGRLENQEKADFKTKRLLRLVKIENVGQQVIDEASRSKFKNFEDAVQNYCAELSGHKILITRNTKDYKNSNLSIMTPKEYLARMGTE
mgnify:CR=1 FL=1